MVLWNIKRLVQLLKEHKIGSALQKNYVIFGFLMLALFPIMQMTMWLEAVLVGLIIVFGVNFAYAFNAKGDGQDFATRFIVLSCPVALRILILRILVVIVEISMITGSMLAPFPYKRIRGVPLKYAVNFFVALPGRIMHIMYNPPAAMGNVWLVFHRLIPLLLLVIFFVWVSYVMHKVAHKDVSA